MKKELVHEADLPLPNPREAPARSHQNVAIGLKGDHVLKRTLGALGQELTARNISLQKEYCSTPAAKIDVAALENALETYWRANQIGDGVYPAQAQILLGSRVQLWEAGTHTNLGYATGHPSLDGRPRCDPPMHTAWAPADTDHVRKHQTVALPVRRHGTQTNHVRKHKHRFDCVKYDLGDAPADAQDGPNSIKLTYTMGCIMLVFRVLDAALGPAGFRDFVLVREMRMGIRCAPGAAGRFPRLQCENKIDIDGWDDREARNKLGRLWTWKDVRGRPGFRVLAAHEVRETVAIMPRWVGLTTTWSIETGVYENRYLHSYRERPPFAAQCPCHVDAQPGD